MAGRRLSRPTWLHGVCGDDCAAFGATSIAAAAANPLAAAAAPHAAIDVAVVHDYERHAVLHARC